MSEHYPHVQSLFEKHIDRPQYFTGQEPPRLPNHDYMSAESKRLHMTGAIESEPRPTRTMLTDELTQLLAVHEHKIMQGISPLLLDVMKQLKELSQDSLGESETQQAMRTQLSESTAALSQLAQRMEALELRCFNSDMEMVALRSKCRK